MKTVLRACFLMVLCFCGSPAFAEDEVRPITREEVETAAKEMMNPETWSSLAAIDAFSRKTMVPNVRMRIVSQVSMPGMPPQPAGDITLNGLEELLAMTHKGASADGKLYIQSPKVQYEITSFQYDSVKKQADYTYKGTVEGVMALMPNMNTITSQACRAIDERQSDGSIKTVIGSCLQRTQMVPIADM